MMQKLTRNHMCFLEIAGSSIVRFASAAYWYPAEPNNERFDYLTNCAFAAVKAAAESIGFDLVARAPAPVAAPVHENAE